jgi:predicted  nucleic acid-binding Zn-ribbon protein
VPTRPTPFALPLALLALAACSDTEARERLRENARATWDSAVEVAYETGEQALAALEDRVAELEPQLERLRARAADLEGQARASYERLVDDLERERLELQQRLEDLRSRKDEVVDRLLREAQAELEGLQERLDGLLGETGG